jgi:hypothetical protein
MTARRRLTLTEKLEIMTRQARCPVCGEKLGRLEDLQFDHEIALGRDGEDTIENLRAIHTEPCHREKTSGGRATTRGSDIQEIARDRRLGEKEQEFRTRLLAKSGRGEPPPKPRSKWPKRKMRG